MPVWVFCTEAATPLDPSRVRKIFSRAVKNAGLPSHFHPHCLRHTFASLLLQQGESPVYVQRQLGHSSIKLTVDTYGKWLPMGNKAAVDRLDRSADRKANVSELSQVADGTWVARLNSAPWTARRTRNSWRSSRSGRPQAHRPGTASS